MTRCERFRISGRVQGVGFRAATLTQARRLGLQGWVQNLADGRVEVLAQGDGLLLDQFFSWLQKGPLLARVTGVERIPEIGQAPPTDFDIR